MRLRNLRSRTWSCRGLRMFDSLRYLARPDRIIGHVAEAWAVRPQRLVDEVEITFRADVAAGSEAAFDVPKHAVAVSLPMIDDSFHILAPVQVRRLRRLIARCCFCATLTIEVVASHLVFRTVAAAIGQLNSKTSSRYRHLRLTIVGTSRRSGCASSCRSYSHALTLCGCGGSCWWRAKMTLWEVDSLSLRCESLEERRTGSS